MKKILKIKEWLRLYKYLIELIKNNKDINDFKISGGTIIIKPVANPKFINLSFKILPTGAEFLD